MGDLGESPYSCAWRMSITLDVSHYPLVLSKFGRGHAAYSRVGLWGIAGVAGVGLLSLVVAYWAA